MIHQSTFLTVWRQLCRRWNRDFDGEEAVLYLRYLASCEFTTGEFEEAAAALWATREFFPRPADFLLARRLRDWRQLQIVLDAYEPPHSFDTEAWEALSDDARAAVTVCGGLRALKDMSNRDPVRCRERFFDALDLHVLERSAVSSPLLQDGAPEAAAPQLIGGGR